MKSQNPRDTLKKIAKEYGYDVRTLWVMINSFEVLSNKLNIYLEDRKKNSRKILTPALVDEIYLTLGEPN